MERIYALGSLCRAVETVTTPPNVFPDHRIQMRERNQRGTDEGQARRARAESRRRRSAAAIVNHGLRGDVDGAKNVKRERNLRWTAETYAVHVTFFLNLLLCSMVSKPP